MKKNKRKPIVYVLILTIIVLTKFIYNFKDNYYRNKTISFVKKNNKDLELYVKDFLKNSKSRDEYKGIDVQISRDDANYIFFYYKNYGISVSGTVYGFYFSRNGEVFDYLDPKLRRVDNHWESVKSNSDNESYMEKIIGNWYFFKITN